MRPDQVHFIERPIVSGAMQSAIAVLLEEGEDPEGIIAAFAEAVEIAAQESGWTQRADGSWFHLEGYEVMDVVIQTGLAPR